MSDCFILLAAGKGKRFKANKPKQFVKYKNKPLYKHSLDTAIKSKLFKKILLVTNSNIKNINKKKITIIRGGKERHQSTFNALKYIKRKKYKNVFIHDAARPNLSIKLLKRLKKELKKSKAVVPYIKSENSVKLNNYSNIKNLDRNKILLTQTPQCFEFNELYKISKPNKKIIADEATLFIENKKKIKFIKGEKQNIKITTIEDLKTINPIANYGIGFDIHRLQRGKKLYLGGVNVPYHSGLKGHSDGDVILHSIIDSILGAIAKNDIGTIFPDNLNKYKNIRSTKMLKYVIKLMKQNNFYINNVDINLICEQPKVSKIKNLIKKSLSKLLSLEKESINLKGKTVEKLGIIGKEKAIACEVICSVSNEKT